LLGEVESDNSYSKLASQILFRLNMNHAIGTTS
jgi:hypothetical protein